MNKIFLTGATGLVGSQLCKALLENGKRVRALKRKTSSIPYILEGIQDLEWVDGDILDPLGLEDHLSDCQVIVHSAAMVSFRKKDKPDMMEANVNGTRILVDLAIERKLDYFLQISSVAAIGRPQHALLIDEKTDWEESSYTSNYARSKFLAEKEVWRGISEGLVADMVNPSVVLGPGSMERSSGKIIGYVEKEKKFLTDGSINVVDVRDVCDAAIKLLQSKKGGERFILSGHHLKYQEFFGSLAKAMKKKAPSIKVSKGILRLAKWPENFLSFLLSKDPLLTKEMINNSFSSHKFSSEKFKQQYDFEYRPLEDTLSWIAKEMKQINVDNLTKA